MTSTGRAMLRHIVAALLVVGWPFPGSPNPAAQPSGAMKSVWSGVYTEAQSVRGEAKYTRHCLSCHGTDLVGNGAALAGAAFWRKWREDSLDSLFSIIKRTMPEEAPGSLTDGDYADILAYVLSVNGIGGSTKELTPDDMPRIRVEGEAGPAPIPDHSLVRVSGCLNHTLDGAWLLDRATEPVRTRTPDIDDAQMAEADWPGEGRFALVSMYPKPESFEGHVLVVVGLLIRDPNLDQLSVTSWKALSACQSP